jgi:hypothetical protein
MGFAARSIAMPASGKTGLGAGGGARRRFRSGRGTVSSWHNERFSVGICLPLPAGSSEVRWYYHSPEAFGSAVQENRALFLDQIRVWGDFGKRGQWAIASGLDPAEDGIWNADPDGDGRANLEEYVMGGNPLTFDSNVLKPVSSHSPTGQWKLEWPITVPVPDDVQIIAVASPNGLTDWRSSDLAWSITENAVTVRSIFGNPPPRAWFCRLRMTIIPE